MKNTLLGLWHMGRPLLLLVVTPIYVIGNLIARTFGYDWDNLRFWWGLSILLPVVLASHYANEYVDYETDALTNRTPFSGGSGYLPSDVQGRALALSATWVSLIAGVLIAIYAFLSGHVNLTVILLWTLGTFVGLAYSLPPFKLAWRGWSEVINAVLIGILLPLYGFSVQTGVMDWKILVGCFPFALLIFILILSTNWADREADRSVGKWTLSARLEQSRLQNLYKSAAILGFAIQPLLIGSVLPIEVVLSSIPAVPAVIWAAERYTRTLSPFPTVLAMLILMPLQIAAWIIAGA